MCTARILWKISRSGSQVEKVDTTGVREYRPFVPAPKQRVPPYGVRVVDVERDIFSAITYFLKNFTPNGIIGRPEVMVREPLLHFCEEAVAIPYCRQGVVFQDLLCPSKNFVRAGDHDLGHVFHITTSFL